MRVTNKMNLPNALVKAVERHEHRKGNFSVTQLLKGSTEIALEMMNPEKLEMDVSDMINMMLGTAVHKLFEEQPTEGVLNEYYMEAPVFGAFTVSGTADVIDTVNEEIDDYKTCSSWKIIFKDFEDWQEQGKGYCWLYNHMTGKMYRRFRIVALVKDWSPTEAQRNAEYPKAPVVSIGFEFTEEEIYGVAEKWQEKIVEVLQKMVSQDYGCCSEKERWAKPAKWALMKEGRKTALKLYDSEGEAMAAKGEDKNLYVEHRAGEDTKCDKYCVAGKCGLCPYRNEKGEGK